jgi:quercetin dioxygenase-like cupin family protein
MTDKSYEAVRITELERPDGWSPIRRHLGVQAFGINAWTAHEAGTAVIPEHDEKPSGHEELYLVVGGRATFTVGGEEIDAPDGTIVFVRDPDVKRGAVAAEPTTVLAVGARPGEAYRPRSWETNADALPLFESGRYEELKQLLLDALERYEDRGALLYNLACAEARLGEPEAALEHLAEAVERSDRLVELARDDEDLASLRGESRFDELIGATTG